ncbi:alpha-hydroxy acid oxidase [Ornithinimicrobium faecis]|uniref:Alpha-hydroxy-acid oxidizing protein n=1 Tax=Ornithinimicrobium faecis TaxID=2934158 RepID=A0ABY4YP27_9MICO|nr:MULTISPECIES: alpha-hydroxy acid oxidase [unclassified Ornithinimicrobium]USQ78532.1 alpha-hydroxy-acid oxidizing protein [Ornithinimicrobium sp. HY1793]
MCGRWLDALEGRAAEALPASVHRYIRQGSRDGVSAAEAVTAWRDLRFRPHVLTDVTHVQTAVTLLGTPVSAPIAVAPSTFQKAVHPDGELAMATATRDAGSLLVVSSNAGTPFADIGATGVPWWLQIYLPADRSLALPTLERAASAGARALVLTVDTPVVGTKHDNGPTIWEETDPALLRVNFEEDTHDLPGFAKATDLGPRDIAWLHDRTGLPVVVKGVLRGDDAVRSVEAGAAAVWVSNHGGRQLDRSISTAHALPAVVEAIGARAEVYVDGGLRTGLDVLSALTLGARATFLGRLPLWALVEGSAAVLRMHKELREELVESMRLAGVTDLAAAGTLRD